MKLRNKKTREIVKTDYKLSISIPDDEKFYGCNTYNEIKGYNSLAELNEEWEDYEEPKEYWYYDTQFGEIEKNSNPLKSDIEQDKQIGNYFETKEEAEKAVEKLKAWKRLKDNGFEFQAISKKYREIRFYPGRCYKNFEERQQALDDLDLLFGGEE